MNEFSYCPYCGTALDPGEKCDCMDNADETKVADEMLKEEES